jgi:hypothetical protein
VGESLAAGVPSGRMRLILAAVIGWACCGLARAEEETFSLAVPKLSFRSDWLEDPPKPERVPFGAENSQWLTFSTGVATIFGDATDYNLRISWSQFLIDDVEFSLEGNLWFSDQPGGGVFGVNPTIVFRWHWVNAPRWSFYGDLGIGFMLSTDAMPRGGTNVNFTPRAGLGWTYQLAEEYDTRLQVGVRWHHISNARITGDDHNPARDLPMLYAGVMIPF